MTRVFSLLGLLGLIILTSLTGVGADLEVCNSGCTYSAFQAAYNDANCGDTITLRAGQTFSAGQNNLTYKSPCSDFIEVRSSAWKLLPPKGVRIDPNVHSALLARMIQTDVTGTEFIMAAGSDQRLITGVDTTNDTITVATASGWSNDDPISCRPLYENPQVAVLPAQIQQNVVYWISNLSGSTFKLNTQIGGPVVDITNSGTGNSYCTAVNNGHHVKFRGIWFDVNGIVMQNFMVIMGFGDESSVRGMVHNVGFDQCAMTGSDTLDGPKKNMLMDANNSWVRDSYLYSAKLSGGNESHALTGGGKSWNVKVENNLLNGASMSYFVGAYGATIDGRVTSYHHVKRNYMTKSGFMLYQQGAGAPTGDCFPGRFYRDTTPSPNTCANGACYTCNGTGYSGTWTQNLSTTYWNATFLTKNVVELKASDLSLYEGNVMQNGFEDADTGNPGAMFFISNVFIQSTWDRITNILFRYNRGDNLWRGIAFAEHGGRTIHNYNLTAHDNLGTNMANYPAMAIHAAIDRAQAFPYRVDATQANVHMYNNTFRIFPSTGVNTFWFLLTNYVNGAGGDFHFDGNIGQQPGDIYLDGGNGSCGVGGMGFVMNTTTPPYSMNGNLLDGSSAPSYTSCITNTTNVNPVPFVSSSDSRLQPGSPYSADCSSGCAYTSPRGTDVGADVDRVMSETSNVETGQREWLWGLQVIPGSTRALVKYNAPTLGTCDVTVYNGIVRTTANENADTNTAPNKLDSRTGNVTQGFSRQVVLGTVAPLTASTDYSLKVSCDSGAQYKIVDFRTQPTGVGVNKVVSYATARTGEYSASASMTSPTSISSGVNNIVPVGAGSVVYYRQTSPNGLIKAFVTP